MLKFNINTAYDFVSTSIERIDYMLGVYYDEVSHPLWFKVATDYEYNTTSGYDYGIMVLTGDKRPKAAVRHSHFGTLYVSTNLTVIQIAS